MDVANAHALHEEAIELAVEASRRSAIKFETSQNDISRDALFAISMDATITHRSVETVVLAGWPSSGAILVRGLFDLMISAAAVVFSPDSRLTAFRYFYSSFRQVHRDSRFDLAFRRSMRDQVRERIASLPAEDQATALKVLKSKERPYWFSEDFSSPSAVLARLAIPELTEAYQRLSAAVHGGFLGMRLFRDDPDVRSINPAPPPGARSLSLLLISGRLLAEVTILRDLHEGLGLRRSLEEYRRQVAEYGLSRA